MHWTIPKFNKKWTLGFIAILMLLLAPIANNESIVSIECRNADMALLRGSLVCLNLAATLGSLVWLALCIAFGLACVYCLLTKRFTSAKYLTITFGMFCCFLATTYIYGDYISDGTNRGLVRSDWIYLHIFFGWIAVALALGRKTWLSAHFYLVSIFCRHMYWLGFNPTPMGPLHITDIMANAMGGLEGMISSALILPFLVVASLASLQFVKVQANFSVLARLINLQFKVFLLLLNELNPHISSNFVARGARFGSLRV